MNVINFIAQNWDFILLIIAAVAALAVAIFKGNKTVVMKMLFSLVTEAEREYGGGTGASVSVTPVAFLICKESGCRILPIPEPATNTVDRLIELIPDIADKVWQLIESKKAEKAAEQPAE